MKEKGLENKELTRKWQLVSWLSEQVTDIDKPIVFCL